MANIDPRIWAAIQAAQSDGRIISDVGVKADALSVGLTVKIPPPAALPESISEAEFQSEVRTLFKNNGWEFYHTHDSRRSDPGFLDCFVARMIGDNEADGFSAELKIPPKKPRKAQLMWMKLLEGMGVKTYLWYPHDWPVITKIACSPLPPGG